MDFFEAQERSHRNTRIALLLFSLAVIAIVVAVCLLAAYIDYQGNNYATNVGVDPSRFPPPGWFLEHWRQSALVAAGTLALILLGSFYQISRLRQGGGYVARSLGGRRVEAGSQDLNERKLTNIVTEMAIASGVPVPEIYVLPDEEGINAFAAGFTPSSAAVGVTRGCIEQLSRDELQGVIAHEFSHILNGDMRLNIRLMGVLHGILLIAIAGQTMMRAIFWTGGYRHRRRGSNGGGGVALGMAAMGFVLMLIGYIGVLFSRLIQAVVSRQREYLADASAVQFTRNPEGIAGALKKIAGLSSGSKLHAPEAQEVSHMLFGAYRHAWLQLFATHPPLERRIQAIDPRFRGLPREQRRKQQAPEGGLGAVAGVSAMAAEVSVDALDMAATAGQPQGHHLDYARQMLASLPDVIKEAATHPAGAEALVLATAIAYDGEVRRQQVGTLKRQMERETIEQAAELYKRLRALGPEVRLPLIDLAMPALHDAGADRARRLVETVTELAWADGTLSTFEFALVCVLRSHLRDAFEPRMRGRGRASLSGRRDDIAAVFAILARTGSVDEPTARQVYAVGMEQLLGSSWPPFPADGIRNITDLEKALDGLDGMTGNAKRQVVGALAKVVSHDGLINVEEYELLRAICESIHCPMPPLVQ